MDINCDHPFMEEKKPADDDGTGEGEPKPMDDEGKYKDEENCAVVSDSNTVSGISVLGQQ